MSEDHIETMDYAMDTLDPQQRAAADQHLAECAECRAEVAEFTELTAGLAMAVTPVQPPPALRATLMEQISHTPQENVRSIGSARPGKRRRYLVAAAAAAVLVAGGGAATVALWPQPNAPISAVQQVESAPDAKTYTSALGDGSMRIVTSQTLGRSIIRLENVPTVATDKTYQAWFLGDTGPVSAGLVPPGQDVVMKGSVRSATGAAVTVEPAGGSKQPTTTPVSSVSFG